MRALALSIVIAAACKGPAPSAPVKPPPSPSPIAELPLLPTGAWVIDGPPDIDKNGVIHTHRILWDGFDVMTDLLALDVHDGLAVTWDGHREGHARVRVVGREAELRFDRDPPGLSHSKPLSLIDGQVVIGDGKDPRNRRYPSFAAARAAVDEDVLSQDPLRVLAGYGGRVGDPSTVAGLIATHLAQPQKVDGRRVTVRGIVVARSSAGLELAAPGTVTPVVRCRVADAEERFALFQEVAATGVVEADITLAFTYHGLSYRGEATGVYLSSCRAR